MKSNSALTEKMINNSLKEFIIQVDRNNKIIQKISKFEAHLNANIKNGIIHRAFSLYLFSDKNLLL